MLMCLNLNATVETQPDEGLMELPTKSSFTHVTQLYTAYRNTCNLLTLAMVCLREDGMDELLHVLVVLGCYALMCAL